MPSDLFVNVTTTDIRRARSFFEGLGWSINPLFSNDDGICVVIGEHLYLMVLTREFFGTFTKKEIPDPHTHSQLQTALAVESREAVDALLERAIASGGKEPKEAQDMGFMYSRDFEDPDGNEFSVFYMDPAAAEEGPDAWVENPSPS